ncbi:hypothetical protein ACF0H5_021256 [Mactra antiquata]
MRGFVFLAVLVAILAVVQGIRYSESPKRDICKNRGHIGACSSPSNLKCPSPMTTCIQGGNGGLCCVKPGKQCKGTCGGFAGATCKDDRSTCYYREKSTLGDCCRKTGQCPPPSHLLGPCVIDPANSCTKDLDCEGRKICCIEGCGKVCMNPAEEPN